MYTVGNGQAHAQDLGDAGSCVRSFRYACMNEENLNSCQLSYNKMYFTFYLFFIFFIFHACSFFFYFSFFACFFFSLECTRPHPFNNFPSLNFRTFKNIVILS